MTTIDELARLHERATRGPWRAGQHEGHYYPVLPPNEGDTIAFVPDDTNRRPKSNAIAIAATHNALPALLRIARAADRLERVVASHVPEPSEDMGIGFILALEIQQHRQAVRAALDALGKVGGA